MAAGLLANAAFLAPVTAAAAAPRLVIPQPVHDIGVIFEDQPLEHVFIFTNAGDAPLQIRKIELDCACSAVDYHRLVPPGGTGKIVFRVEPYSGLHKFCKKGDIFSNDPENPVVTIQLCAHARPFIEIQPSHIIRFDGRLQELQPARVRLISHQKAPLAINGFTTDLGDRVGVTITEEKPGQVFEVEVANRMNEPGAYKGKIELQTSSDKRPRLILRVFADIVPAPAKSP